MSKNSCHAAESTVGAILRMALAELLLSIANKDTSVNERELNCYY